MSKALAIAGIDPTGGAGLLMDIKVFHALGVYGIGIPTVITIQDTSRVYNVCKISISIFKEMLSKVLNDVDVNHVKCGVLYSREIIQYLSKVIESYDLITVLDPIIKSRDGYTLLENDAFEELKASLIPKVKLLTPNVIEAEYLSNLKIRDINDIKRAIKEIIRSYGCEAVLVKGGHLGMGDEVIDVLYTGGTFHEFRRRRLDIKIHGTGCILSSAITAELCKGKDLIEAVKAGLDFLHNLIETSLKIGKGYEVLDPTRNLRLCAEKFKVLENLNQALEIIEKYSEIFAQAIPEVQSNLAMALPEEFLRSINDVAAIPGRIINYMGKARPSGSPRFGASNHLARILLTVMKYNSNIRAVMNIKYSDELVEIAKKLGYIVSFFDRNEEPEHLKKIEGATLPWGIEIAIKRVGKVPDIIYDKGDVGKEPLIRVLGRDAVDVALKVLNIMKNYLDYK